MIILSVIPGQCEDLSAFASSCSSPSRDPDYPRVLHPFLASSPHIYSSLSFPSVPWIQAFWRYNVVLWIIVVAFWIWTLNWMESADLALVASLD